MNINQASYIASLFDLPSSLEIFDFPEKGNINRETYLVVADPSRDRKEYILQQINPSVFKKPMEVMHNMALCIAAQSAAISSGILREGEDWEPLRLIPTKEGKAYVETPGEEGCRCWRMMARIIRSKSYRSLWEIPDPQTRLRVAEEAGRGLAIFGMLTSSISPHEIQCSLPGYRDTNLYYNQLLSVLAGSRTSTDAQPYLPYDPCIRQSTEEYFVVRLDYDTYHQRLNDPLIRRYIDLALENRNRARTLLGKLETGELRTVIIHGDTKLENFLFDTRTGRVKALVDLDTIMPHTWLYDWGDMARSLINPSGEREKDLEKVTVDTDVFESAARGFLSRAHHVTSAEMAHMVEAVLVIALELGVRFLTDYLRGDNYFSLAAGDPPDLNKIRAGVQFRLFETALSRTDQLENIIWECLRGRDRAPSP